MDSLDAFFILSFLMQSFFFNFLEKCATKTKLISEISSKNYLKKPRIQKVHKEAPKTPIKCSKRNMIIKSNYFEKS